MPYFVYILFSATRNRYYVGQTDNIIERLISHNTKISPDTSTASDWRLVYDEVYATRQEAISRERKIKAAKSRKFIEALIRQRDSSAGPD